MRRNIISYLSLIVFAIFPLQIQASTFEVKEINLLGINSAITPATYDYLKHQFSQIAKDALIVIKMNTPGGLVTTTKDIITLIGRQKNPVAVWITPEGASASSAGAIIASAAHFIFMAPGTNMGAATPVGIGEDLKESDGRSKALNDLAALVRSLSHSRGRPSEPFEEMIRKARSYTDKEALKLKIIDGVLSRQDDLASVLEKRSFNLQGQKFSLTFSESPSFKDLLPTTGQKILEVLANPSTAYLLFLLGIALIYFEFQAPGGYIAGSIGLTLLILTAIAFQVLPLDWGALGLILLGVILLVLEVFITSYGILSLSGIAAFVMGSLFLFHGEGGFISIEYPVLFSTLAGVFLSVGIIVWYLYQDKRKQGKTSDFFVPRGMTGPVLTKSMDSKGYQVKVRGEIWKAFSDEVLDVGEQVEVIDVDQEQLLLKVKKKI